MKTSGAQLRPVSLLIEIELCCAALADIQIISHADPGSFLDDSENLIEGIGDRWMKDKDWSTAGIVLMHLADRMLNLRLMEQARKYYRAAALRFSVQVDSRYRQHEAAATYGLALVDFNSSERENAIRNLDKALKLLKQAEYHWLGIYSNYENADLCRQAQSVIRLIQNTMILSLFSSTPYRNGWFLEYGHFRRDIGVIASVSLRHRVLPLADMCS